MFQGKVVVVTMVDLHRWRHDKADDLSCRLWMELRRGIEWEK